VQNLACEQAPGVTNTRRQAPGNPPIAQRQAPGVCSALAPPGACSASVNHTSLSQIVTVQDNRKYSKPVIS